MDVSSAAVRAVSSGNVWALALAFTAGVAGGAGPCVAPRFIAVAAFTLNRTFREGAAMTTSFVAGLVAVYVLFAAAGSLIWEAFRYSSEIYVAAAAIMAAAGLVVLAKAPADCVHPRAHRASAGSTFLAGASSAAILSPCCTPVVMAAIAYGSVTGLWFSCVVMACFALGHALPASLMALGGGAVRPILTSPAVHGATRTIGGSLMLALAGYYAVIA